MRWRPVAAAAAGVVAAIGLSAHGAAAETPDGSTEVPAPGETPPGTVAAEPTPTAAPADPRVSPAAQARLDRAAALADVAHALPPTNPSPKQPTGPLLTAVLSPAVIAIADAIPQIKLPTFDAKRADVVPFTLPVGRGPVSGRPNNVEQARAAMAASASDPSTANAPRATPVDDTSSNKTASSAPASAATTTSSSTSSTATPPPTVGAIDGTDAWWPTWAGDIADQRLSAAWRSTPVRGPPPTTASALGNDGRTTIYQVSIVDGNDGFTVGIATQDASVFNGGVAGANAISSGSATATGDMAVTSIYQTSVIVQRGSGTATVAQGAHVDNIGSADATSAGIADARAVGNASNTTVHQTVVVLILGSGDAQVSQTADVTNAGVATAVATDQPASATGTTATTDVNQIAVLVVHEDDVTVNQASTTTNVGVGDAAGGTTVGNSATNTVSQVTVAR